MPKNVGAQISQRNAPTVHFSTVLSPTNIVIVGLPGTGKTRLALALAGSLAERDLPVLVAHTDVLKITARHLTGDVLEGPGYAGDCANKAKWTTPLLVEQARKAAREGYWLIVEGTLAASFHPSPGVRIELTLDSEQRETRLEYKHASAALSLQRANLDQYAELLAAERSATTVLLDSSIAPATLVANCLELSGAR